MDTSLPTDPQSPITFDEVIDWTTETVRRRADPLWLGSSRLADSLLATAAMAAGGDPLRPLDRGLALRAALAWAASQFVPARTPAAEPGALEQDLEQWLALCLQDVPVEIQPDGLCPLPTTDESRAAIAAIAKILWLVLTGTRTADELSASAARQASAVVADCLCCQRLLMIAATFWSRFPQNWLFELARGEQLTGVAECIERLRQHRLLATDSEHRMVWLMPPLQRHWAAKTAPDAARRWHLSAFQLRTASGEAFDAARHLFHAGRYPQFLAAAGVIVPHASRRQRGIFQELLDGMPAVELAAAERGLREVERGVNIGLLAAVDQLPEPRAGLGKPQPVPSEELKALLCFALQQYLAGGGTDSDVASVLPSGRRTIVFPEFDALCANAVERPASDPQQAPVSKRGESASGPLETGRTAEPNPIFELDWSSRGGCRGPAQWLCQSASYYALGQAFSLSGKPDLALEQAQQALACAQQGGNQWFSARCLLLMSWIYLRNDRPGRALHLARLAESAHVLAEDEPGQIRCLQTAAAALLELGAHVQALTVLENGLRAAARLRDSRLCCALRTTAIEVNADLGDWPVAANHWRAANIVTSQLSDSALAADLERLRTLFPEEWESQLS